MVIYTCIWLIYEIKKWELSIAIGYISFPGGTRMYS